MDRIPSDPSRNSTRAAQSAGPCGSPGSDGVPLPIPEVISNAREAQEALEATSQETVDELTTVVYRLVCDRSGTAERWAEKAVAETGQGDVRDKVSKTTSVVELMYEEMADEQSVGRLKDGDEDPVEIGKPVGVIGAHTPSTNCASTPVSLALTAFKGGNALIISPSPYAVETCDTVVADIQSELETQGFPRHLIQSLSKPIRKRRTETLLRRADAIQVTGSRSQVELGQTCGTPNYCVGAGNTVGIVDTTADLATTADQIAHSAAFDNGLVCVCMSNILVSPALADEFGDELAAAGGYICSADETIRLRETLYDEDGISPDCIGRSASEIASMSGFGAELDRESFLVPVIEDVDLDDPLVRENLSPVTTLYEVPPDEAPETTNEITRNQGRGHSCAIYGERERAIELADEIDVCRIALNQSSIGLSVGDRNRIETSLSLGCGTWGGNQTDENITYEHFTNTTTIYDRIERPTRTRESTRDRNSERPTRHPLRRIYEYIGTTVRSRL